MNTQTHDEKALIRKSVLSKRESIDSDLLKPRSIKILNKFISLKEFKQAEVIMFYASFGSEVETFDIIDEAMNIGKKILLPRVDKSKDSLKLYEIKSLDDLRYGYMGIPEPIHSDETMHGVNFADLIVMPGAGFDLQGNRLGYGKGYYDKMLSKLKKKIPLIALAFEEQIVENIPSEPHDIRVDAIVTDERVIWTGKK